MWTWLNYRGDAQSQNMFISKSLGITKDCLLKTFLEQNFLVVLNPRQNIFEMPR